MPRALITDCEGPQLSEAEREWFGDIQPFGFILFQRHCENPQQLKQLVADLRACVSHHAPVFIDQEGGKVARLKPPHWEEFPAAEVFAHSWKANPAQAQRACYLNARMMAKLLTDCGINADCAPLADIPAVGAHDVIGSRAFGHEAESVIALARAQASGLQDGGVLPVLKHIPGHGRAMADSHLELPTVDAPLEELEQSDFLPFKALKDIVFGMTAHIRFSALDDAQPISLSPKGIRYIREEIGFANLLMSDDISMKALNGPLDMLAEQTLDAGCDLVLHCNGSFEERQLAASGCRTMPDERYGLYEQAIRAISMTETDIHALRAERDALLKHDDV